MNRKMFAWLIALAASALVASVAWLGESLAERPKRASTASSIEASYPRVGALGGKISTGHTSLSSSHSRTYAFEIEPQTLRTAVPKFARQAGDLSFALSDGTQATHVKVNGVSGTLTRSEALRRMLESTEVTYSMLHPDLIVFKVPSPPSDSRPE